jgi:hypothetical protein
MSDGLRLLPGHFADDAKQAKEAKVAEKVKGPMTLRQSDVQRN